jgi:hypothetical protein
LNIFSLQIQVAGRQHSASAETDGATITVATDVSRVTARSVREAVRIANDYVGPLLRTADRNKLPWGLHVAVGEVAAVYGAWPLLPGPTATDRTREELVSKIRREYRDGSSATAALENADRIIDAYTRQRSAA